jgi:hypothetical protein
MIVSLAVLGQKSAVCFLLKASPLAPIAGGNRVGLRSGLLTQMVPAPPSWPTLQIMAFVRVADVDVAGGVEGQAVEAGVLAR